MGIVGKDVTVKTGIIAIVRTTDARFRILKRESGLLITAMTYVQFKTVVGPVIAVAAEGESTERKLRHLEVNRYLRVRSGAVAEADEGTAF